MFTPEETAMVAPIKIAIRHCLMASSTRQIKTVATVKVSVLPKVVMVL